jgi:cytochrome c556
MSRRSRFSSPLLAAGCVAFSAWSASGYAAEKDATGFIPDITVAEIMESIVMPAAQKVWDAVGVDVTAQGTIEKKPQNDDEWAELRAAAVTLAEATNSLVVPGRHAAPAGTKSENPDAELEPAEIEALLAKERPAWVAHAAVLHATAMQAITAIDARNIDQISEVGGAIDEACESCHLQFWYPEQK